MRKYVLTLFVLSICSVCCAQAINVDPFVTNDDVTIDHLEQLRVRTVDAINSASGALLQNNSVTTAKLDANANPENRWNEGFNDFVFTGLTIPTSASLSSTTTSGTLYMNGVRVVKDATAKTYTASKHTFVDLSDNGTYTYSEVEINASEPGVAANSLRLARVSTDGTTVLEVRDDRVTTITLAAGSVGSIEDTDSDTKIQTEESADEDILRFDLGNATLTSAREVLTIQAIDANDVKLEPTTDSDVDLGSSSLAFKILYVDTVSADDVSLTASVVGSPSQNTIYKDNVTKVWINLDGTGTIAISGSFNVTSVTDTGTGLYDVTFITLFANDNYAAVCSAAGDSYCDVGGQSTSIFSAEVRNQAGSLTDADPVNVIIIGDQ